jgi:murein L,D-transpeptidase YcbB/YkuD
MDPITLALIAAGGAKAIGGIAQGVGTARAARALALTPGQQAELDALRRRRRRGELGLTGGEEARLRRRAEGAQMGVTRDLEAMALQQAAAQQAGGRAVSGRDIFLQEQAEQQTLRTLQQAEEESIRQADIAERQAERAQIAQLEQQAAQAEAQRRAGIAQAVTLGLTGAADVGMQAVSMQHAAKMQDASIPKAAGRTVLLRYQPQPVGFSFGGLVPEPEID